MHRHHRIGGERQLGPWARKTDKSEAGQYRGKCEPAYDLDPGDGAAVRGGGIHIAITDRRQRLHAEEEGVREAVRSSIRYRAGDQPEECSEDDIHRQIK